MSANVRFWGTIVLLELKKAHAKACLRLWLGDSLFALHGSGCGYENTSYQGFRSEHQYSCAASLFLPHCMLWWRGPWSTTTELIVSPILQTTTLCPPFSPQPINTSLCPSLSIDKSLRSNAFLCCCQSKRRYDFVFSSFDTCIAFTHTHCSW